MFHAAMSEGSMGLPRFGPSASALPSANVASPQDSNRLRIYMAHLSLRVYGPAHDRIEVVIGKTKNGWNRRQLAGRGPKPWQAHRSLRHSGVEHRYRAGRRRL